MGDQHMATATPTTTASVRSIGVSGLASDAAAFVLVFLGLILPWHLDEDGLRRMSGHWTNAGFNLVPVLLSSLLMIGALVASNVLLVVNRHALGATIAWGVRVVAAIPYVAAVTIAFARSLLANANGGVGVGVGASVGIAGVILACWVPLTRSAQIGSWHAPLMRAQALAWAGWALLVTLIHIIIVVKDFDFQWVDGFDKKIAIVVISLATSFVALAAAIVCIIGLTTKNRALTTATAAIGVAAVVATVGALLGRLTGLADTGLRSLEGGLEPNSSLGVTLLRYDLAPELLLIPLGAAAAVPLLLANSSAKSWRNSFKPATTWLFAAIAATATMCGAIEIASILLDKWSPGYRWSQAGVLFLVGVVALVGVFLSRLKKGSKAAGIALAGVIMPLGLVAAILFVKADLDAFSPFKADSAHVALGLWIPVAIIVLLALSRSHGAAAASHTVPATGYAGFPQAAVPAAQVAYANAAQPAYAAPSSDAAPAAPAAHAGLAAPVEAPAPAFVAPAIAVPVADAPAPEAVAPASPAPAPAASVPPHPRAAEASNPATDPAILQEIAATIPELRAAVAANPSTYQGLLDWLRLVGDPEVDKAIAARGQ